MPSEWQGQSEDDQAFDQIERLTRRVFWGMVVGVPVFVLVLALLLPVFQYVRGLGGMTIATLVAAWAVVITQRRLPQGGGAPRPARRASPETRLRRIIIGMAVGIVVLIYLVFVIAVSGSG